MLRTPTRRAARTNRPGCPRSPRAGGPAGAGRCRGTPRRRPGEFGAAPPRCRSGRTSRGAATPRRPRGPATSPTSVPRRAPNSSRRRLTPARQGLHAQPAARRTHDRSRLVAARAPQDLLRGLRRRRTAAGTPGQLAAVAAGQQTGASGAVVDAEPAARRAPRTSSTPSGPGGRTPRRTCRCGARHGDPPAPGSAIPPVPPGARAATVRSAGRAASATGRTGETRRQGTPSRRPRVRPGDRPRYRSGRSPPGRPRRGRRDDDGRQPGPRARRRPGCRPRRANRRRGAPRCPRSGTPGVPAVPSVVPPTPSTGRAPARCPARAHAGSPTTASTSSIGSVNGGWRTTVTPARARSRSPGVASPGTDAAAVVNASGSGGAGKVRTMVSGDAMRRKNEAGPAQRHAAHSASSTAGRWPPAEPRLERQEVDAGGSPDRLVDHPAPHRPPVERCPHRACRPAPRRASRRERRSRTSWPRRPPRYARAPRVAAATALSSVMRSSPPEEGSPQGSDVRSESQGGPQVVHRGVASHVNSFSERPKWP